jgi:hypothetical protein
MYGGEVSNKLNREAEAGTQANPLPRQISRAPQVRTHIEILTKELDAQRDTIQRLFDRLEPILSVAPPGGQPKEDANEPAAPLAATVFHLGRAIARNTALLDLLMSRIEV